VVLGALGYRLSVWCGAVVYVSGLRDAASFGHHYAHHQELKSIVQVVAACGTWCFGLQVVGLVWSCSLCVWFAGWC
jgi:hypothetical protein